MITEMLAEARMAEYERIATHYGRIRDAKRLFSKARPEAVTSNVPALEPHTGTKRQTAP
jgi:hypothetical protein